MTNLNLDRASVLANDYRDALLNGSRSEVHRIQREIASYLASQNRDDKTLLYLLASSDYLANQRDPESNSTSSEQMFRLLALFQRMNMLDLISDAILPILVSGAKELPYQVELSKIKDEANRG